ncbi:MAG: hypothetical protein AB1Y26_08520 [Cycloclasticus sp.]
MKRLFFLLVFVNIVYFFWGMTASKETLLVKQQAPLYNASKLEKLLAISKEDAAQLIAGQAYSNQEPEVKKVELDKECFLIGDFDNENKASESAAVLNGLEGVVSIVPSTVLEEFWVVYPADEDWNQSLLNVEQLQAKGVTDFWLVPNGTYMGTVSLGLFITIDRANKRLGELRKKEVEAEIIRREKYRYSIKVETKGGIELIQHYLRSVPVNKKNSIRKISC